MRTTPAAWAPAITSLAASHSCEQTSAAAVDTGMHPPAAQQPPGALDGQLPSTSRDIPVAARCPRAAGGKGLGLGGPASGPLLQARALSTLLAPPHFTAFA